MKDRVINAILGLLRIAVCSDVRTAERLLPDIVDWQSVYSVIQHQGISALVLDAIDRLPSELHPPKPLLMQLIGLTAMMERMYAQHEERIASLAKFYESHGIHVLLLKGYGCSLCYPQPKHRPTGDIDIYLFGKQDRADDFVEKELGIKVHRGYHKHSTFSYGGVEVENHAKFIDDISHRSNIRFECTLMSVLAKEKCIASNIDNVLLPPPTFNALFLLRHTGEHFASCEITLRHVLDVGLFFQRYHADIDWALLHKVYAAEHMTHFFNAIATICVAYLDFKATSFASPDEHVSYEPDMILAQRILADIFEPKDNLPMTTYGINTVAEKLKYAMQKSCRWWRNRWKYQLVYDENLVESFCWLARNRMR